MFKMCKTEVEKQLDYTIKFVKILLWGEFYDIYDKMGQHKRPITITDTTE